MATTLMFSTLSLCIIWVVWCDVVMKNEPMESDIFEVVYRDKSLKLSSTEKIDKTFLAQLFNVDANDIIGFQRQDGLLIRLQNENLLNLIKGKVVILTVVEHEQTEGIIDQEQCEQVSANGYNIKAPFVYMVQFYSLSDGGNGAVTKMNDWLRKEDNKDVTVIDIKAHYPHSHSAIGYNYWIQVIYSKNTHP